MTNFDDVGDFHEKMGWPNVTHHGPGPREDVTRELIDFRLGLIDEEVKELKEALEEEDLAAAADALIDLAYVTHGMAHRLGLPWDTLWADVHAANMRKVPSALDGSNNKRAINMPSADAAKPPGWVGPDGASILKRNGFKL